MKNTIRIIWVHVSLNPRGSVCMCVCVCVCVCVFACVWAARKPYCHVLCVSCVCVVTLHAVCVSLDGSSRPEHSRKVFIWPTLKHLPHKELSDTQIKSCFLCRSEISWRQHVTASTRSIYTVMLYDFCLSTLFSVYIRIDKMWQTEPRTFLINCNINACNEFESSLSCCLWNTWTPVVNVRRSDLSWWHRLDSISCLLHRQSQTASDISRPFISVQSHTNSSLSILLECIILYLNSRVYMDPKWFSLKGEQFKILSR